MVNHSARFWAYANYLFATAKLITGQNSTYEEMSESISTMECFSKLQKPKEIELERLAQNLRLSWYTELLLIEQQNEFGLLMFSLPWGMVQTYYAIYPALYSLLVLRNPEIKNNHTAVLNVVSEQIANKPIMFLEPWASTFLGNPNVVTFQLHRSENQDAIEMTNPLYSPHSRDGWEHYGLMLRTTHQRFLTKRIETWKKVNHRKLIRQPERQVLIDELRATTIFDALYRIRTRANYQDVDSLYFGNFDEIDAYELNQAFLKITSHSLFHLELLITRIIGKKMYKEIIDTVDKSKFSDKLERSVLERWEVIRTSF